ncbi:MAG: glycine zipper 2TM domain-containing protein [Pseudomonadaceae bacterium]|nr:glycine zipper 2TM domain-containing protein [Pseudomonadaceae bacterium]
MNTQTYKHVALSAVMAAAVTVSACAPGQSGIGNMDNNQALGTVLGGVAGGFLGGQFGGGSGKTALAVAGALAGAWAGNALATRLTAQDRGYYDQAVAQAQTAPVGQQVTWYNPSSGAQGTITPTRVGETNMGYCREYSQTITVAGRTERAYGTACQQADGTWRLVN